MLANFGQAADQKPCNDQVRPFDKLFIRENKRTNNAYFLLWGFLGFYTATHYLLNIAID